MSKKPSCLIVDDETDLSELLSITLEKMGISTDTADTLDDAKFMLRQRKYDLCLTDMRLPDGNGLDLVRYIGLNHAGMPVAVITAYGSAENAVSALKTGAFDYLTKPISLQQLRPLVQSALKLASSDTPATEKITLIGDSSPINEVKDIIDKVSKNQAPVLISGETGSGKELAARLIHMNSSRRNAPFVKVNCGSIPEKIIESEFLGQKKGASNESQVESKGLLQAANGGTLFLDAISDLPISMQIVLLSVIQDKKIRPLGSDQDEPIDVRIISATHRDIQSLMDHGLFRHDLYYRLNVITLSMPALRDMPEDIPKIADDVLQKLCIKHQRAQIPVINEAAKKKLMEYSFHGNVRELENVLERALAMCNGNEIQDKDLLMRSKPRLASNVNVDASGLTLPDYLENIEKQAIIEALQKTGQNKTAAAKLLGVSFRTLRYRLSKLGLSKEEEDMEES